MPRMDSEDRLFAIAEDVFVMIVIAVVIVGLAVAFADQQVPKRLGCGGHTTGPGGGLVCRFP